MVCVKVEVKFIEIGGSKFITIPLPDGTVKDVLIYDDLNQQFSEAIGDDLEGPINTWLNYKPPAEAK